ncbi:FAD-dependent monooxygenase [Phytoactinopolyspora limicola]|uniref:FAD-dependent monooxygenase n=1 Tax=Phytoactinopolyspora limicola TaxID=2715536 RepID=UPI001A9C333E|nr:FAD-dependent monooxygenase [Phytoactinopolyspora limicola]
MTLDITVVGGGIAGLTVAAALDRAGMRCTVFEQVERPRAVGAGLQISPNAARLLHRLGLEQYLRATAVRPEAIELRRWDDGRVLGRTALGDACEKLYGAPYYTMHRVDLYEGLLQLAAPYVRFGCRIDSVTQREVGDGIVVGADGVHSVVRATLTSDRPRFSGQTVYRALVPSAAAPWLRREPKVAIWPGPGRHCVCYPVSGGSSFNIVATAPAETAHAEWWTTPATREELMAAYSGWDEDLTRILDASMQVTRWSLHDRDTMTRWGSGRLTLAGDAAHPMLPFLGQGANMAIEDACALAACLRRDGPGESTEAGVTEALRRYESRRQIRTERVHQASRENARTLHLYDGDGQRKRDAAVDEAHNLRNRSWLFGHDAEEP